MTSRFRFRKLFNSCFDRLDDQARIRVVNKYVLILRNGSSYEVDFYEGVFFKADHIKWVSEKDQRLVIDHVIARIDTASSINLFDGLFSSLKTKSDLKNATERIMWRALSDKPPLNLRAWYDFIARQSISPDDYIIIKSVLEEFGDHYSEKKKIKENIEFLMAAFEFASGDLPF